MTGVIPQTIRPKQFLPSIGGKCSAILALLWIATWNVQSAETGRDAETRPLVKTPFICGAWLPYWGMEEGKQSLRKDHPLNDLSPVWYEVNQDGSLQTKIKASAGFLKQTAHQQNLRLMPSIAIFDYKHLAKVIGVPENQKRHIDSIVSEVEKHQFDGVDIDYEAIAIENKDNYFHFLEALAARLHANKKKLSVTVLSKWGDHVNYPLFPQTRKVQDWSRIAKLADEVRIMAYDYTMATSTYPGPIAPNHWVESVLTYATSQMPSHKIILGIHLYGFEWSSNDLKHLTFQPVIDTNPLRKQRVRSYTSKVIQNILSSNKGSLKSHAGESIFRYQREDSSGNLQHRALVFPSQRGVTDKVKLAHRFGIKGVYFWRIGSEAKLLSGINLQP